jgi:hypothetical protein
MSWRASFSRNLTKGLLRDRRPGATQESRALLTGLRRLTVRALEPSAFVFGDGTVPMPLDESPP